MSFMSLLFRRAARAGVAVLCAFVIAGSSAQAGAGRWTSVGPESEPLIHSLAVHPTLPTTVWAGGVGNIWKTEDGGKSWTGSTIRFCEVRMIAIDPSDPSTLYATCIGALKSTDGGATWTPIVNGIQDGDFTPSLLSIVVHPTDPATLYAGSAGREIYKSVDAGSTWTKTGALPNQSSEVRALVIDPTSPETVYAATTVGGVFKTVNGGVEWKGASTGLVSYQATSLALDPRSPSTLYAGTIRTGIFKSTDGADSWVRVFGPGDVAGVEFTVAELVMDPFSSSTLYAAMGDTDLGVFQTTDAGATWRSIREGLPFYPALRALAIAPSSPSTLYVGSTDSYPGVVDGGVFKTAVSTRCPAGSGSPSILEFPLPTAGSSPVGIAEGPDCALWFTENKGNRIGRITAAGEITEFAIPTPNSNPSRIVAGNDGALWFTEFAGNKIGRITTAGVITEFAIATPASRPNGIAAGPDGNIWFTEMEGHAIGRITPEGAITEFLIPPLDVFPSFPLSIAAGANGNLWFSEFFTGRVGRVTPEGAITLFRAEPLCCADLGEIAAGPDGNLWFAERWENAIGRITPSGTMTYFPLASRGFGAGLNHAVYGIAAGGDGALWFTNAPSTIGRITTTGVITEVQIPTTGGYPEMITKGPDGNMWFTESVANKIGRILIQQENPRRRLVRR